MQQRNKYILKYKGSNNKELLSSLSLIKSCKDLSVIDGNDKLMLVEMGEQTRTLLEAGLNNWSIHEQAMVSKPPDHKKKLKGKTYK